MIKIVDACGNALQRFRVSDCPMCRDWPIDMAGGCACCEGKSTAMASPDVIAASLIDALTKLAQAKRERDMVFGYSHAHWWRSHLDEVFAAENPLDAALEPRPRREG